ncbi:MAG: hypothetical protein AAF098_07215 [Pseudomonadota bacterium]
MTLHRLILPTLALLLCASSFAQSPQGREIAYVMTDLFWSVYQTEDAREECPRGFNDGPREQFETLFADVTKHTVESSQLEREVATWHPTATPDGFEFKSVEGPYSWGMNLDGKSDDEDFQHPDGTVGIDNQVYRAVGCIIGFRGPDGVEYIFQNKAIIDERYNRMMIRLTDIDDLLNDDFVGVDFFRGRDRLLTDATGEAVVPGGTQRVDDRWGERLIRHTTGRIANGVLTTVPISEAVVPWMNLNVPSIHIFRDLRFELSLSATRASGQIAGYADVDTWYHQLIRNDSTHHLSNGQISAISLYRALRRFADAYPDEAGTNRAISTALKIEMTQVHVIDEHQSLSGSMSNVRRDLLPPESTN